ncbi:hypothetical protein LP420_31390 [Massilia sp. B-10]|nr:hypothetical protein LP420_31390 [Massilia sp. B-10]
MPSGDDAAARVAHVLAAGTPQVSNLIRGQVTQALIVVVDVPVKTPDGTRYVISQGFRIEHFNRVLRQVNLPKGWLAGVFDRNGITIAQTQAASGAEPQQARADLRHAIRDKTIGVIRNASDNNISLYTVLERSGMSGWTVAVGVPESEIESAARRALTVSMLGLGAAIACAAVAAIFSRAACRTRSAKPRARRTGSNTMKKSAPPRCPAWSKSTRCKRRSPPPRPWCAMRNIRAWWPRRSARSCSSASTRRAPSPNSRTAPRTNSWPCWATSCAIPWPPSSTPPASWRKPTCRARRSSGRARSSPARASI